MVDKQIIDELDKAVSALTIRGTELSEQKVQKIISAINQAKKELSKGV